MTVQDSGRQTAVYNKVLAKDQAFVGSFSRTTGGVFNPVTGVTVGATTTTFDGACVFVKASKGESIPDNFVITDPKNYVLIVAAQGNVPDKKDVPTLLGTKYAILGVIESSAGDDSLFRIYVKKGNA